MAFPEIKKENQGKFKRWVKRNMPGESTCSAASKIMKAKEGKYSGKTCFNKLEKFKNKYY